MASQPDQKPLVKEDKNQNGGGETAEGGHTSCDQDTSLTTDETQVDTGDVATGDDEEDTTQFDLSALSHLLKDLIEPVKHEQVLSELTVKGIADYIMSDKCQNIIVMTGAGISTAAGIPDFRSPETGLYSQLEKYNLPYPQSIFELAYFKENPEPFCLLAKEMWPGNYKPTISHYFLCLLERKKLLLRSFTQNIDGLELVAGLPEERLIAAHGTFHTSHCIQCKKAYNVDWMKDEIFADKVPKCQSEDGREVCTGIVKPDIVFFGEALPERFFTSMSTDFPAADLLIVMGTSLQVQPFCLLVDKVDPTVPRLLINREKCREGMFGFGFDFTSENKYRDVALLGDCDEGCLQLADLLGWKDELLHLAKADEGGLATG